MTNTVENPEQKGRAQREANIRYNLRKLENRLLLIAFALVVVGGPASIFLKMQHGLADTIGTFLLAAWAIPCHVCLFVVALSRPNDLDEQIERYLDAEEAQNSSH